MKTVLEHIEHIKGKPHHVRKRIAFAAAVAGTTGVALVWLVGSLSFGAFAIQGASFADSTGQGSAIVAGADSGNSSANSGIAGTAAALPSVSASAPAHIEIIDTTPAVSAQKKAEQTTIPF